jgi:hypothetical protein
MARKWTLALLAIAVALVAPAAALPATAATSTPVTFGRETVADPVRLSFEPSVAASPDGTVYESPIFGFRTTQSFIQRSDDGGQTFNVVGAPGVGKVSHCTGGGDSDISTSPHNDLYMIDLGDAPEVPAHVSADHGNSFTSSCLANLQQGGTNTFADRQWLSTDTVHGVEWYIYRDGLVGSATGQDVIDNHLYGEWIWSAPLSTAPGTAGAPQLNFSSLCKDPLGRPTSCVSDINVVGGAVTDNFGPHRGNTYLPVGNSPNGVENDVSVIVINPTAARPVVERVVSKNTSPVLFSTVAVDRAGNLYFAWVDSKTLKLKFSSSSDQGATWTPPLVLNTPDFRTTVMPWLVAGDDGRVDLVFYGTTNPAHPTTNFGPWYGWMLQSLNAHAGVPSFTATRFTDRPMHLDPVCLSGIACYTIPGTGGDRELGDFFKVVLDGSGRALISFDDGNNQLGSETPGLSPFPAPSFASFVRQATGPSLFAAQGDVPPVPVETNSVTRPPHHNPVPFTGPTGPGADVDALNITASRTTLSSDGVHVTMNIKNLDATAAVTPPALPTATYLTRWWHGGKIYYAAAEDTGGSWSFFSGQVAPVLTSNNVGYAYYPASGAATGKVTPGPNGRIDVTVQLADAGNPKTTDTLYSVTSYAFTHALPSSPTPPSFSNFTDYPQVADVAPAYNVLRAAVSPVTVGPNAGSSGGGGAGGGGLPDTGTGGWPVGLFPLLVLVVLIPRLWRRRPL